MLRVGFDARWHNSSGVGAYVRLLLNALSRLPDEDFKIFAYQFADAPLPIDSPHIVKKNISGGKYSLAGQWQLMRACHADHIDVFHAPFFIVPLLAPCPVISTFHDLMVFLFPIYGALHQNLVKLGYRVGAIKADSIIAISETTANDLKRLLQIPPHKLALIQNAYPTTEFHQHARPGEMEYLRKRYGIKDKFVVTMSASNWRTKNLPNAFRAMAFAQQDASLNFQPVIVGNESGYRNSGCTDLLKNALVTGFVPDEDLPILYRHAASFLTVSLYEGYGRPLVEAMACGCPCIVSNGGSLAEVAGNAAPVLDCQDFEGMGRALVRLLKDHEYAIQMRQLGLARAADFSDDRMAQQTLSLYRRLASSRC